MALVNIFFFQLQKLLGPIAAFHTSFSRQLSVFNSYKQNDYEELVQQFDNVRMDFNDIGECFSVINNIVANTPAQKNLLSIFQHLLFIQNDIFVR